MPFPFPSDPVSLIAYSVVFLVSTYLHRSGALDKILGPVANPSLPVPPVGKGGLIVTGLRDILDYLRTHRELLDEVKQITGTPAAPPPAVKPPQ